MLGLKSILVSKCGPRSKRCHVNSRHDQLTLLLTDSLYNYLLLLCTLRQVLTNVFQYENLQKSMKQSYKFSMSLINNSEDLKEQKSRLFWSVRYAWGRTGIRGRLKSAEAAWGGNRFFVRPLIDPRKIGFIIHESIFTGDPLHSRALAHSRAPLFTQPCPHCSHSRAPGEQWTRLCVFTLQGCVQAARLCRGSPVILVPWFVSEESTRCLSAARLTRDRGACETIETRENLGPF